MRVVLVGSALDCDRLRSQLPAPFDIAGQALTLEAAVRLRLEADAFLVAPASGAGAQGPDDEGMVEQRLTPREIDVIELLAEGHSNKAIAARLGISDQTVKFHVASICAKLGASNRTDAVRRAARRGLITL